MTTFGITSTGFVKMRLQDIKDDIEADLRANLGNSINLLPESVFGQLVGIQAERESKVWDVAEDTYNSQYPDTASNVSLDNVAAISGIRRLAATKSLCQAVTLNGTTGSLIPAGTVLSVNGNSSARFLTNNDVTLASGTGTVDCTAESTGPVQALSGTLTVIATPVTGLTSVNNSTDAIRGRDLETDSALRIRRSSTLQIAGAAALAAIASKLLDLTGVTNVIPFENETDATDSNGRPPHSFEMVVAGGDSTQIATTILGAKCAGIKTYGNQTSTINDSMGVPRTIYWSRPTNVPIYVIVNVTTNTSFPAGGSTQVLNAIVAAGNSLGIGGSVIVSPFLISSLASIPGITGVTILVSKNPTPTLSTNITIAANEISVFSNANTAVNIS